MTLTFVRKMCRRLLFIKGNKFDKFYKKYFRYRRYYVKIVKYQRKC